MPEDVTFDVSAPLNGGEAVDISSTDHTATTRSRSLWVGTSGIVKVVMRGGATLTFNNVQDGTMLPIRVTSVSKTTTTASNMVLLW